MEEQFNKTRKRIESKKKTIREKGARECFSFVALSLKSGSSNPDAEVEEWAIALAEYLEENPKEWEGSNDPPGFPFKSFKDKLENILDVLRKFVPPHP